jgi:hypothetical protein
MTDPLFISRVLLFLIPKRHLTGLDRFLIPKRHLTGLDRVNFWHERS